jgi:hypothetical protein
MKQIRLIALLVTALFVFMQFKVSMQYEPVAQMVGIMDTQSQNINTAYLDYEEQSAILRSSKFLVTERANGFVAAPAKVLYVNSGASLVSSNE